MIRDDKKSWPAVGIITLVGAVLRLVDLGRLSFWIDEIISVCSADAIHDLPTFFTPVCGNMHPPLYFFLLKIWSWGGNTETWLRLMPALFGVATIPVVYLLGREMAGRTAGLAASGLAAISPFLLLHDRELRMYSLLTLLSTSSMLFFLRAMRKERRRDWMAFTALSILNLYVHYHAVLVLFGQGLLCVLWFRRLRLRRQVAISVFMIACAFAFWMPQFIYQVQHPALFAIDAPDKFPVVSGAAFARLAYVMYAIGLGQTLLPWRPIALAGMAAFGVLGTVGLWRSRHQPDLLSIVGFAGLGPILAGFAVSQSMPRYYVFVAPVYFIVASIGLLAVRPIWVRVAAGGLVVVALGVGISNYYRGRDFHVLAPVDPWREVGAYLLAEAKPGDCLMPIGSYRPVLYYTNNLAPFTKPVVGTVAAAAACLEADPSRRLWLVTADSSTAELAEKSVAALDSAWDEVAARRFLHDPEYLIKERWFRKRFLEYRVSVYGYQARPKARRP